LDRGLGGLQNRTGYRGMKRGVEVVRESNPCYPAGTYWFRSHVNSVSGVELRIAPEESSEVTANCYSPRVGNSSCACAPVSVRRR
jgi:hypothetical protein